MEEIAPRRIEKKSQSVVDTVVWKQNNIKSQILMLLSSALFPMHWTQTLLELMTGEKVGSHCESKPSEFKCPKWK